MKKELSIIITLLFFLLTSCTPQISDENTKPINFAGQAYYGMKTSAELSKGVLLDAGSNVLVWEGPDNIPYEQAFGSILEKLDAIRIESTGKWYVPKNSISWTQYPDWIKNIKSTNSLISTGNTKKGERYFIYLTESSTLTYIATSICQDADNTYPDHTYKNFNQNSLYTKSTVKYDTKEFTDQCSQATRVIEGYCTKDGLSWNGYSCPNDGNCVDGACQLEPEICLPYIDSTAPGKQKITYQNTEYDIWYGFNDDFINYGIEIYSPKDQLEIKKELYTNQEQEIPGKNIWISAKIQLTQGKYQGTICFTTQPKNSLQTVSQYCQIPGFQNICNQEKIISCDASCSAQQLLDKNLNKQNCILGCLLQQNIPTLNPIDAQQCAANQCTYDNLQNNVCDQNCALYECKYDLNKCPTPTADYKQFKGQEFTLQADQTYTLDNNLQLKINTITNYETLDNQPLPLNQQFVTIELDHAIQSKKLFLFPITLILAKNVDNKELSTAIEYVGYRLEYKNFNPVDNSVTVIIHSLTSKLNSAQDLLYECKKYRPFTQCHILSQLDPLTDEITIESSHFLIQTQKNVQEYAKFVKDEAESCYLFNKQTLGIDFKINPKTQKFPIRLRSDYYQVNQVNTYGMWLYIPLLTAQDTTYSQKINGKCDDGLIAHEIVHTMFQDKFTSLKIPDILNEGLATYITNKIQPTFSCQKDGIILSDGSKRPFYPLNKYGLWPFSSTDGTPTSTNLYLDSACLFTELEQDIGTEKFKQLIISMHNPTKEDHFIDILKENNIDPAKYQTKYTIDNSYVFLYQKPFGLKQGKWDAATS